MFQFPANPAQGQKFSPVAGTTYEWNGMGWVYVGMDTASLYPPGIIMPYAGASPLPFQGWVLCNGQAYNTTDLPALFAIIGFTYGGGGASFLVPDLRGRVIAGIDSAGRLSSALSNALGAVGGIDQVQLAVVNLPAHAHGISDVAHSHGLNDPSHSHGVGDPGHAHGLNDPGHSHGYDKSIPIGMKPLANGTNPHGLYQWSNTSGATTGITIAGAGTNVYIHGAGTGISIAGSGTGLSTTNNTGSGGGHLNVQPTITLNFLIKT